MPKHYDPTVQGVMGWARAEFFHAGELSGMRDKNLQYAYAQSTVNSMMHLHDAMLELLEDKRYRKDHADLRKTFDSVVRALKELIERYNIDIAAILAFNTRHVLRSLAYLRVKDKRQ